MKKMILAVTVLVVVGASLQTARAGDREWATAGKILTGVVAGAVIASALDCPPAHASVVYTYNAPLYCSRPAVVYALATAACPAPVVYSSPVVVYRTPVCVPQPVVVYAQHRHYRGYEHWRGRHDRW